MTEFETLSLTVEFPMVVGENSSSCVENRWGQESDASAGILTSVPSSVLTLMLKVRNWRQNEDSWKINLTHSGSNMPKHDVQYCCLEEVGVGLLATCSRLAGTGDVEGVVNKRWLYIFRLCVKQDPSNTNLYMCTWLHSVYYPRPLEYSSKAFSPLTSPKGLSGCPNVTPRLKLSPYIHAVLYCGSEACIISAQSGTDLFLIGHLKPSKPSVFSNTHLVSF